MQHVNNEGCANFYGILIKLPVFDTLIEGVPLKGVGILDEGSSVFQN